MRPARRGFLFCSLVAALPAFAQLSRMRRVGVLTGRSREAAIETGLVAALAQAMHEHGHVEGRNVQYDWRYGAGDYAELRRLAEDLVRLKVDVIVADGTSAISAAKQATAEIPIVMSTSADPVGSGFVQSLARPGGNITGQTSIQIEAVPKRLELLAAVVPGLARIGALGNPANPSGAGFVKSVESAAKKFKLAVVVVQAKSLSELEAAFARLDQGKVQALVVTSDAFFIAQRRKLVDLAARSRLPVIYPNREYFDVGGLMVYGVNTPKMFRSAAAYVDKILKGARPGELAIEQPDALDLLVNLKTAEEIGLKMPQTLLIRANEVVR